MDVTDAEIEAGRATMSSGRSDSRSTDTPDSSHEHSLLDDVGAMFSDGRTYLEAELAFQKSRGGFAANRLKWAVVYGAAAFGLLHLALIALTVGVVIALAPLIGAWLATGLVTMLLLASGLVLLMRLRSKIEDVRDAFGDDDR